MPPKPMFDYRVFPAWQVQAAFTVAVEAEAFVAEDLYQAAIQKALQDGYRWTRTEGDWAIFERFDLESVRVVAHLHHASTWVLDMHHVRE